MASVAAESTNLNAYEVNNLPKIGFGTWIQDENGETENQELILQVLNLAFENGYTMFDISNNYKSTTVCMNILPEKFQQNQGNQYFVLAKGDTIEDFRNFRDAFNSVNVDVIFMMHYTGYTLFKGLLFTIWAQISNEIKENPGQVKGLAVSNILQSDLKLLLQKCDENNWIKPIMNEIEISPIYPQFEFVDFMKENNIVPVAVSSLRGLGYAGMGMYPAPFGALAENSENDMATIISSWLQKRGISALFCSKNSDRQKSNLSSSCEISNEEMNEIRNTETMNLALTDIAIDIQSNNYEGSEAHQDYPQFNDMIAASN